MVIAQPVQTMAVAARIVVLSAWFCVMAACGSEVGEGGSSEGSESWSVLAPSLSIGEVEGAQEYLFQSIAAARLLPDGGVAVADRGLALLRVYEADGSFRAEMGRRGEGPGEFAYISSMTLHPPDTLEVYDSSLFRLTRYRTDGSLVGVQSITLQSGFPEIFLGRYSNGDMGMAWIDLTSDWASSTQTVRPDLMQFGRFDGRGQLVELLGTGTGIRRSRSGPVPFSPELHAFLLNDSIYFTDGLRPEIQAMDGQGRIVRAIPLPVHEVDEAQAREMLVEYLEEAGAADRLEHLRSDPLEDSIPVADEVLVDDEGQFWVKQYDPRRDIRWLGGTTGVGGDWWVVDRDGAAIAQISVPEGFRPLDVVAARLVGVSRDELGVQRVQVAEVVR